MKHISITRVKATKRIFELGQKGSVFYVILRGCVRLFSQVDGNARTQDTDYETIVRNLKPDRDLFPGDVFGEEVSNCMGLFVVFCAAMICSILLIAFSFYHVLCV